MTESKKRYSMMKRPSTIFAFLCSLVLLCDFACSAKFVSYPVTRALPENGLARFRRADTVEVLTNNLSSYGYYASVQVGTPSQTLSLLLGTGSSDVWVIDTSAPTCSSTHCATPCTYQNYLNLFPRCFGASSSELRMKLTDNP